MRFRSRAMHAPPAPRPAEQQFVSLSFPVQATYLGAGSEDIQQQQPATPRFQSVSQDSVVGQYRQHVSPDPSLDPNPGPDAGPDPAHERRST